VNRKNPLSEVGRLAKKKIQKSLFQVVNAMEKQCKQEPGARMRAKSLL
jgi:hypothetical protein